MRKLCCVIAAGFALAAGLIFFFGDSGLASYGSLSGFRDRLSANVGELASINGKLTARLESLKGDPSETEALAGTLGLFAPEDRVILLEDAASRRVSYEAGTLIRPARQRGGRDFIFKLVGAGAIIFFIIGVLLIKGFARTRAGHDYRRG